MSNPNKQKANQVKAPTRRVRLFLTGLSMGIADLVPGVSGGTVALLYGIYDELLYSIRVVTGTAPRLLLKGDFKKLLKVVPFSFLLPLMTGIIVAIFGFAGVFSYLLDSYPVLTWSIFFGLIAGSALIVRKRVRQWNTSRALLLAVSFLVTYLVLGMQSVASVSPTAFVVFMTGAIAICAMILPGISGSLIMVLLGQYKNVIGFVSDRNSGQIITFALGALLGLAIFSRLLSWLLRTYHDSTIAVLIGIMLGSLRRVWPWQNTTDENLYMSYWPEVSAQLAIAIVLMVAGFLLVIFLEKQGIAREHKDDIQDKDFKKEIASRSR